jgi:tRNA threonylcarbamoyladenosine biosynthesis protein TsaB
MIEKKEYTLAIETAGKIPSVSILKNEVEIDFAICDLEISSSSLVPIVKEVLERNHLKISQFNYLTVSLGPGSFTGVRIGLATAKGINFGTGLRCIGVNYLEAIAFSGEREGKIRTILSGGRDEFYVQDFLFESKNQALELTKPQLKSSDEVVLLNNISGDYTIITDRKAKQKLLENKDGSRIFVHPDNMAKYTGLAGINKIKNNVEPSYTLQPIYVRESEFKVTQR